MHAAGTITAPLHAATVEAVISLIAASRLRVGEALGLDQGDVDLDAATLSATGRNDHTRLIPLHANTFAMLGRYARRHDHLRPAATSPSLFITTTGRRVQQHSVQHTFAVYTLTNWYRTGVDVSAHLPVLSAFLGHASPEATYWHL